MILVTYLPFYRIHEVMEYFDRNVELLRPERSLVYLDNVFHKKQEEIARGLIRHELVFGNWGNRGDTWFAMLKDLSGERDRVVFVDSDNVLEPFAAMAELDDAVYTVLDRQSWERGAPNTMKRSAEDGTIRAGGSEVRAFRYRIYDGSLFRSGPTFFIGPKQAVVFNRVPERGLVERVERAFSRVDPGLRRFVGDETVLGVLAYLSGIREVRWFVGSNHFQHGSANPGKLRAFVALAHSQFGAGLYREFRMNEFRRYWLKYRLAFLKDIINV